MFHYLESARDIAVRIYMRVPGAYRKQEDHKSDLEAFSLVPELCWRLGNRHSLL